MSAQTFGLLELGSNSLKHYRVESVPGKGHRIETRKIPWRVAHDFFTHGELREETLEELIEAIASVGKISADIPLSEMLCLATGVFRELSDIGSIANRIKQRTGLRLRVISGEDEAKLMGKSLPDLGPGSTVVADLGGATTEWVLLEGGKPQRWGSVPLGAIRIHRQAGGTSAEPSEYLRRARELCAAVAAELTELGPSELLVTGGTAKALARSRGADVTSLEELRQTIDDVVENGAPSSLKPERREVYLSGLVILEQLATAVGATELAWARASVREGMARRLVTLLANMETEDLHSTLLLHTTSTIPREVAE